MLMKMFDDKKITFGGSIGQNIGKTHSIQLKYIHENLISITMALNLFNLAVKKVFGFWFVQNVHFKMANNFNSMPCCIYPSSLIKD